LAPACSAVFWKVYVPAGLASFTQSVTNFAFAAAAAVVLARAGSVTDFDVPLSEQAPAIRRVTTASAAGAGRANFRAGCPTRNFDIARI